MLTDLIKQSLIRHLGSILKLCYAMWSLSVELLGFTPELKFVLEFTLNASDLYYTFTLQATL